MNLVVRTLYASFVLAIAAYQRLFMDMHVWGREHIPPGPKIFVANHITSYDAFYVLPWVGVPLHTIIGPGYESKWVGKLLDAFEQINALDGNYKTMISSAVGYLEKGESIAIAPEGNLHPPLQLGQFQPGVATIYRLTRAPMIPMALVAPKSRMRENAGQAQMINGRVFPMVRTMRGPYCINIGEPCRPEIPEGMSRKEQNELVLNELRGRVEALMEDVRANRFWLSPRR